MIIKNRYVLIFIFIFFSFTNFAYANNYIDQTIDWHKVKVIKYDLQSKDYTFKIWINNRNDATNLRELMEAYNWISAINWVYFCPADYWECNWENFTINERYVNGIKHAWYESTWDRVVFALDQNNIPFLFQTNKINPDRELDIYNWLWNFPLILKDWKWMIEYYRDLGLIDSKMRAPMARNFICSDKEKKNIYVWYVYNIELDLLNWVLLKLGCWDALNLDAWKSSAMIYNSRYTVWPGRNIMDWIIIERNWLNTREAREIADKIMIKIDDAIKNKSKIWKIMFLDKLSQTLKTARNTVYDKYSIDLYDDEGNKNWYEIQINDTKILKVMYAINYLDKLIYEKRKWLLN